MAYAVGFLPTQERTGGHMPKAILEFIFPDDEQEFRVASAAMDWCLTVWDFDQWLRSEIKYRNQDYQVVRDKLHEILRYRNLDLDMIT